MSDQESTSQVVQRELGNPDSPSNAQILRGLAKLAEAIDSLRNEQAALRDQLQELNQHLSGLAAALPVENQQTSQHPLACETPKFNTCFLDYEIGELFPDTVGFDLTVEFADQASRNWYRAWQGIDGGQILNILLESCAQSRLPELASEFTYRRDVDSVTVFARQREVLQELLTCFLNAHATAASASSLSLNCLRQKANRD